MSFENQNPESAPSLEEQQARLNAMLVKNMQVLVSDREFFSHLLEVHNADRNTKPSKADQSLSVSKSGFEIRKDDGAWEKGEYMYTGITTYFNGGVSSTKLIPVAKRIQTPEGDKLIPEEGFTPEQAEMVTGMIDELTLAKMSGQIPDLHEYDLNTLFVPSDSVDPFDRY